MHSITGVRHALATVLTALATASVALVAAPALAGTTATEPSVGECHDLTIDQAYAKADTQPAVDCAQPHTVRTIAVGTLPDNLDWDSSDAAIGKAVDAVCRPAFAQALGRNESTRLMSAYGLFWFEPTKGQRADGARWFTCELGLYGGGRLLDLPTDAVPALPEAPLPDSVALCRQGRTYANTTCARKHAYRAAGTFVMRHDGYPGKKAQDRIIHKHCPAMTAPDPYVAWYLTRPSWKAGFRTVTCFAVTRS